MEARQQRLHAFVEAGLPVIRRAKTPCLGHFPNSEKRALNTVATGGREDVPCHIKVGALKSRLTVGD
jgi:hypothetical protein